MSSLQYSEEEARDLQIWPLDAYNEALLKQVRPKDWKDPQVLDLYDLVVIGAGAGGLVSAKQAARRGAKVAFISEHLAGGDCLNVGCVPSKALLRCARAARDTRRAAEFGVILPEGPIKIDFPAIMQRMRKLRAKIAPVDSHEATAAAGAQVFQGRGRFVSEHSVHVNNSTLNFRKAIIATGGRASVPDLPGLREVNYLTNSTIFNLTQLPPSLCVLGGGAVGLEMAQCFATFGTQVTVVLRGPCLQHKGDRRAGATLMHALEKDGVEFIVNCEVKRVSQKDETTDIMIECSDGRGLKCSQVLVATGRTPNVNDLGLEAAGVAHDSDGIVIDKLLCTSNPDVYAVGDCASSVPRLTHVAGEMAKMAVQNALFGDTWEFRSGVIPQCTYTEPEHASVGHTEASAKSAGIAVDIYETSLKHNDRVILEGDDDSDVFAKILTKKDTGCIIGATVVSGRAGDIIAEVTLAIHANIEIASLARTIACYPTQGEGIMQASLGFIRNRWEKLS